MGRRGRRWWESGRGRCGGGIGGTEVGFDLDDAAGEELAVEIADEELAEEGSGDDLGERE